MRFAATLALLMLPEAIFAAEPRVYLDLAYAEPKEQGRTLDIYSTTDSKDRPVVVWIHGGGWQRGDKSDVAAKPWAFINKGYVFVSANYRLFPKVTIKQMVGDVAKVIRWVHKHAEDYGGDPNTVFVMGHSAGAFLGALVCTDDRYLNEEGLSLSIIKGCVPVDGATYDVPMQVQTVDRRRADSFRAKFGNSESQKDLSAVTYIEPHKYIPPFLILHVADPVAAAKHGSNGSVCCPETKIQSRRLAEALRAARVSAKVFPAPRKTHMTLNSELGLPGDESTKALFEFLDEVLQK